MGNKSRGSTFGMLYSINKNPVGLSNISVLTGYKKYGVICRINLLSVFWKLINPFHSLRAAETCRAPVRADGRKGCSAMQKHVYHFSGTKHAAISSQSDRNPPRGSRSKLYHFTFLRSILAI